jgi:type I restriction enzyme S subunit
MIAKGYKQTDIGIIPEDWKVKELDSVLKFGSGQDYKHLSKGSIPVYGTGGVMTFVNNYLYDGESVGIGRKGTIDKPVFLSGKFWTVDTLFFTHSFLGVLPKLIYYNFLMIPWKEYNEASGVPSLNKNTLGKIKIPLPPTLKEQEAIAKVLTGTDNLIQALENVIAKKKAIKKGAMQQLLTPPNKVGKRFYVFSGECVEKCLGRFCEITTVKLDANSMVKEGIYRFYTCAKRFYHINNYAFDTEALLISGNGANVGYIHYYKGKFNAYQRTYVLTGFEENIFFIKHYLDRNLKLRIDSEKNEGNTPYIVLGTLVDMFLYIPATNEEQEAIATVLSDMDKEIEALEVKKEKYLQLKKGLAQELLTGKTRLV